MTKPKYLWLYIVALIVALAVLVWFWWSFVAPSSGPSTAPAGLISPAKVDQAIKKTMLDGLAGRRQYGQWPLSAVPLSEARGNPFSPKAR